MSVLIYYFLLSVSIVVYSAPRLRPALRDRAVTKRLFSPRRSSKSVDWKYRLVLEAPILLGQFKASHSFQNPVGLVWAFNSNPQIAWIHLREGREKISPTAVLPATS